LESESVRNHAQQQSLVLRVIGRLRQNPLFTTVPIWVIPENNLGLEASHVEAFVSHLPYVHVFHEFAAERAGVRKSATNTVEYQICVEDMLRRQLLHFHRDVFTNSKRFLKGSLRFFIFFIFIYFLLFCAKVPWTMRRRLNKS
jgi:hypothetical protein